MIRQALGRAVLVNGQNALVQILNGEHISTLCNVIKTLLPSTSEEQIRDKVGEFFEAAVLLKSKMTEEQAIYRCYFPQNGERSNIIGSPDSETEIFICTFPSLSRLYMVENTVHIATLVQVNGVERISL